MKVFSKVINDKTKQLDCIICGDIPVLEGYSELEREEGYDGNWYLKGYAPEKPAKEKAQEKIEELKAELAKSDYIDNKFLEAIVKEDNALLETYKIKYKDKLEERQSIRNQIDELEEIING